jgi:hypothetical protein
MKTRRKELSIAVVVVSFSLVYPRFGPNSSLSISAQLDDISFRSYLTSVHSHFGPFPFDYVLLVRTDKCEVLALPYE